MGTDVPAPRTVDVSEAGYWALVKKKERLEAALEDILEEVEATGTVTPETARQARDTLKEADNG